MRKLLKSLLLVGYVLLAGCGDSKGQDEMWFSVTSDYPPFEYISNNELVGFDIDLARLVAHELGKEAKFKDMQFGAILVAVHNGTVDASISTLTITPERQKNFDFSDPYFHETLALITPAGNPIARSELADKHVACQIGSAMEQWLKINAQQTTITTFDTNPQAIEALKAGHVQAVLIDEVQAVAFVKQHQGLAFEVIAKSDMGYGIAFKQGSALVEPVNQALERLKSNGELDKLKHKYLEVK